MLENDLSYRPERHPLVSLLLLLIIATLGFAIVGPMIGFLFALPFYPGSVIEFAEAVQQPLDHPELKVPLYIMQGFATLVGLIVGPALFMRSEGKSVMNFFRDQTTNAGMLLLIVFLVIVFMGFNSIVIEWNAKVHFPDFLQGFENWAREREDIATDLTKFLTDFKTPADLVIAMVVIALLPALGEEIVFRGLFQNQLYRASGNSHVAIWVAAFLFSAIHFQFFGFVPRLLLGALFGYLYYWSGNLWLPIAAHFVNNGFSVLAMYFYKKGDLEYDVESIESVPLNVVIISGLITFGLLYYFYQYYKSRNTKTENL